LKSIALTVVLILGCLLVYVAQEFPGFGDPGAPANVHVSPFYIENAMRDTAVPNMVTAILADYRGFDTLFETSVIFTAGLACFFLLRVIRRRAPESRLYRHIPTDLTIRIEKGGRLPASSAEFQRIDSVWVPYDLIIHMTGRLIVPFIQLFALYVIAHGHYSPGGGFQGGVILGAAVILFALCNNLRMTVRRFSERTNALLCSLGVIIYAGTGVMCMLLGSNFLDYGALAGLLGVDRIMARSHGIMMVEIGVAIAVNAVMVWIYYNLSSVGRQDEGL
jgi:multicomponent Na+:H+ antiporter subunit B